MGKIQAVVLGYGNRGASYSDYAVKHPDELEIVAVADPIANRLQYAAQLHSLPEDRIFTDWRQIADQPKMANFAIIATQDHMHLEPALAMIEKGYNLLLEKPMATTPAECKQITEAAEKKGVGIIVCHVLRFTSFWTTLKGIIDSGAIGKVMSITHMENVGNRHQSHSFVRGNWRKTSEATPMILAKCCHDTDLIQWLIGKPCKKVQSFGSLTYFTKENKPAGAPARCTDGCPHADTCFYNAILIALTGNFVKFYCYFIATNNLICSSVCSLYFDNVVTLNNLSIINTIFTCKIYPSCTLVMTY